MALIRAYLDAGIMSDGEVLERYHGAPQGGPLRPLLARHADDCNVYVCMLKAGAQVMALRRRLNASSWRMACVWPGAVRLIRRRMADTARWLSPYLRLHNPQLRQRRTRLT